MVKQRRTVLLTGSVYKGKTTLAQLVASALCPEAWWINVTEREPIQVDTLFLALAGRIESGDCPSLVIIDDLDISPAAHRVYRDSLALVLHRASATGRGVLLTAQGASSDSVVVQDFSNVHLLEVPEMSTEEVEGLCREHGCSEAFSKVWGTFVTMWTRGHPKLVQVQIAELAVRGWPKPSQTDLTAQSPAVTSARQMARQLLAESVSAPMAEFVYLVSECSVLMHRTIAIRLIEAVDGLTNAGDVLGKLTGKWLEVIGGQWFRTTALLQGVAADVWSPERRKLGHIRLYDAIRAKGTLDPSEAAALLFHAFIGQDHTRLAHIAMRLQIIEDHDAKREVERQLLWLPLVALEPGQSITDDVIAGAILRQLQFQAASTLDSDALPKICEQWRDDIERIQQPQIRSAMLAVMCFSVGFSQNLKVPLRPRLWAIAGIQTLPAELQDFQMERSRVLLGGPDIAEAGIPPNATTEQMMFLFSNRSIRDSASFEELLHCLDNEATEELRQQFDAMLEWPIVQAVGAFVQGAWAAEHEETQDWTPWLNLLEKVDDYAKRHISPRFGREAAKAKAILLAEYLNRSDDAINVLDHANVDFGSSAVLLEQRANVLFHKQDDEKVLEIWAQLTSDPAGTAFLDLFAYRRAGISAARLKRWAEAVKIFLTAAAPLAPGHFGSTKFGLQVDAALVASLGGDQASASRILAEAVLTLPSEAATEGDLRWDAVQRVSVEVCRTIERSHWKQEGIEPRVKVGDGSSTTLKLSKAEPGQKARTEMTRVQALRLATTLIAAPSFIASEIEALAGSKYVYVRWYASEARLAASYADGAGAGFIRALVALEKAYADLLSKRETLSLLEPDEGPASDLIVAPEQWFGLLAAGIICGGNDLLLNLNIWLEESGQEVGVDAPLVNAVKMLIDGASGAADILEATLQDAGNPATVRCGAAARLLCNATVASNALQLQEFLTSALVSDKSSLRQELFNLQVARRFAGAWRVHAENRFQFSCPRTTVPALLHAIDDVEAGSGTLRSLLEAASNALGTSLGSFMERVL